MSDNQNNWQPTASIKTLQLRADIVWRIRNFFHAARFWEVHTPVLSRDTVMDRHIDPIVVDGKAIGVVDLSSDTFYLQTSPEFAMKRLLAAGADRIYQIGPVFRSEERGAMHNPEFTMVEWYRRGDDLQRATDLLIELLKAAIPNAKPMRETYAYAFERTVGVCPLSTSIAELKSAAHEHRLPIAEDFSDDIDTWLNLLFAEVVQPKLGFEQPTIITHFPASQSALARISPDDERVAERFELFIGGVELANGYNELLDANELADRNSTVRQQRLRDGKSGLNPDSRLLAAMRAGLPQCSGCALGLDRLVMVVSQSQRIEDVLCFPVELA